MNSEFTCRACHEEDITLFDLPTNSFITSDCKNWNGTKPQFFTCECKYVGKILNVSYKVSLDNSYKSYSPYWQTQKNRLEEAITEQKSLDFSSKELRSRSDLLVKYLLEDGCISQNNISSVHILEYGCGNGPFIDALVNNEIRNYIVDAADLHDTYYEVISKKNGFREFYNLTNQKIDQTYDLITLVHVLEHVDNPVELLNSLSKLLTENGKLLIQVPNASINPFDFIIADHLSHFNLENIIKLIQKSNLKLLNYSLEVIPKELTLILGENFNETNEIELPKFTDKIDLPINFILEYESLVNKMTSEHEIIIFGTSVGAIWLTSELQKRDLSVAAYLDEDESRVGKRINSVEIMHPRDFNSSKLGVVLMPLAPILATEILLKYPKIRANVYT